MRLIKNIDFTKLHIDIISCYSRQLLLRRGIVLVKHKLLDKLQTVTDCLESGPQNFQESFT